MQIFASVLILLLTLNSFTLISELWDVVLLFFEKSFGFFLCVFSYVS